MSPSGKPRFTKKDLRAAFGTIAIPAPHRPRSPTPPKDEVEGQLQHCRKKQRVESDQVCLSGVESGPSSAATISGSGVLASEPVVASVLLRTGASSLPPPGRPLLPPSLIQQFPELPSINPSAFDSGEFQQLWASESRSHDLQEKFTKASDALELVKKELDKIAAAHKNLSVLAAICEALFRNEDHD